MMDQTPDTTPDTADGLWVSVSALAGLKGVAKQTISEKVARLVGDGKLETRPGKGKAKLINVAAYDRALGETTDLARQQGAATKQAATDPATPRDPTFTKHQADRAGYEAELKRLDLEERLGKLRTVEAIEDATVTCGETVVRLIDQLVLKADEIAAAVAKDGVTGARTALKSVQFELRTKIAEAFTKIAATDDVAATPDPEPPTQ
jgi:hypothetical protein